MTTSVRTLVFVALLGLLPAREGRADPDGQWSGCNTWGCWSNGDGCNTWGCWNSRAGACNTWGCSNNGTCTMHGCPPGPTMPWRGRQRATPPPVIVQPVPVPVPMVTPQRPSPPPSPPPRDYARDTGVAPDALRQFDQHGIRFTYSQALTVSSRSGKVGSYAQLSGPGYFTVSILRMQTSRSPEAVRNEDMDELVKVFVAAGQRKLGSSMIEADFRDGVRQGLRVRMDNRDDVVFNDSYAWRRADGDVLLVTFSYKSQERDQALRFIPTIAQSLQ